MTCSMRSAFICPSMSMPGACWLEISTVESAFGRPSSYTTDTWVLPSGRRYSIVPSLRTAASCFASRCASQIGMGMRSGVSSHAYPNIIPWSPAPTSSKWSVEAVADLLRLVDALRDVGRLLVDRGDDRAGVGVEPVRGARCSRCRARCRARCAGSRCWPGSRSRPRRRRGRWCTASRTRPGSAGPARRSRRARRR